MVWKYGVKYHLSSVTHTQHFPPQCHIHSTGIQLIIKVYNYQDTNVWSVGGKVVSEVGQRFVQNIFGCRERPSCCDYRQAAP